MPLRLIEMVIPAREQLALEELLRSDHLSVIGIWMQPIMGVWELPVEGKWQKRFSQDFILVKAILSTEETEGLMDLLEKRFSHVEGFRLSLLPVEATVPRPGSNHQNQPPQEEREGVAEVEEVTKPRERRSREELRFEIERSTKLTNVYLLMVVLSSIVAAIGILNDNVAVIIGAMVIAPLLGPNVGLALGTTLGDLTLVRDALRTNLAGIILAVLLSTGLGYFLAVDPSIPEIASRTRVGLVEVALALASGCAGSLAFTTGLSATLIGVMVAVALLPPLVTFGLLLGSGQLGLASGALELFLVNLVCVNLAGVATFLAQEILPGNWWEAKRARLTIFVAFMLWLLLLAFIVLKILTSDGASPGFI